MNGQVKNLRGMPSKWGSDDWVHRSPACIDGRLRFGLGGLFWSEVTYIITRFADDGGGEGVSAWPFALEKIKCLSTQSPSLPFWWWLWYKSKLWPLFTLPSFTRKQRCYKVTKAFPQNFSAFTILCTVQYIDDLNDFNQKRMRFPKRINYLQYMQPQATLPTFNLEECEERWAMMHRPSSKFHVFLARSKPSVEESIASVIANRN